MKKRKESKPVWSLKQIVEVTWRDSNGYSKWESLADYAYLKPALCRTVGYLLHKDKKEIVIVFTQSMENEGDGNGAIAIPRGCVKSIKTLVNK